MPYETPHSDGGGTVAVTEDVPFAQRWTKAGPIISHPPASLLNGMRHTSDPAASEPGAMSLFAFAVGTLLVALPVSGRLPMAAILATVPALLIFAGIGQFVGGVFAYRKGDTVAATAFCMFGANNIVVSAFVVFEALGMIPGDSTRLLLGIDLLCFAFITFVLFVASIKINGVLTLVLLALVPGYFLTAVPNLGGAAAIGHIGGWFLIISAGLAFYNGAALVINGTFERPILPMFPRRAVAAR